MEGLDPSLAVPVLGLLIQEAKGRTAIGRAMVCLIAVTAIAVFVRFDPVAETVADYASLKG